MPPHPVQGEAVQTAAKQEKLANIELLWPVAACHPAPLVVVLRQQLTCLLIERRKARCERELGHGIVALHLHAAAGAHTAASFWVGLLRASYSLEDVWWWSEGAAALTSSYSQARAL